MNAPTGHDAAGSPGASPCSDACIHIIDDDLSFRASLAFLLDAVGLKTCEYPDAASFLRAMPDGPGCVLLDLAMPEATGLELQRTLAALEFRMPIVFISAHGDLRSGVRAMRAGAEDFLTKPVDCEELLDAVRRALSCDADRRAAILERDELRSRAARLSARETEVLRHVLRGRLNKQIAADLGLALQTVKFHRAHVMSKLEATSVVDLSRIARLVDISPI